VVLINGPMVTGRDAAHSYLLHHDTPYDMRGGILYHCGPVMLKENEQWRVKAAGPTTSIREEPYEADIIHRFGLRAVMAKAEWGQDERGAKGIRRGVPPRYRRSCPVLCAVPAKSPQCSSA